MNHATAHDIVRFIFGKTDRSRHSHYGKVILSIAKCRPALVLAAILRKISVRREI